MCVFIVQLSLTTQCGPRAVFTEPDDPDERAKRKALISEALRSGALTSSLLLLLLVLMLLL